MSHEQVYVPEGITFGNRVLRVPSVLIALSHSGFLGDTRSGGGYTWVNRGDPVGVFHLRTVKPGVLGWLAGEKVHSVDVPCPASGLFVHRTFDFATSEESSLTAILLPDDEPTAEDGAYMFSALTRVCWDNRDTFLKNSRYWSMEAFSADELKDLLDKQVSLECRTIDAMPRYKDYFDEARTRYPNLRPHLKHLR